MIHNRVIENNNGATPTSDGAPGLVGTGMTIAGGRNDLVVENTVLRQRRVGAPAAPLSGRRRSTRRPRSSRSKTTAAAASKPVEGENETCLYEAYENEIEGNTFSANGGFGNPSNGDIGEVADPIPGTENNCWHGNVEAGRRGTDERTPADPDHPRNLRSSQHRGRAGEQRAGGAGDLRLAAR